MCMSRDVVYLFTLFFFSSRRRHTRCALVTGVQTCALPISEIAARGQIAQKDRLAADILLDHHRTRPDDIDIVALVALGQHDLARGDAHHLGPLDHGRQILHRQPALEDLEQLPFERYAVRSEEHTSELKSLMRISYAVFCLKQKTTRLS